MSLEYPDRVKIIPITMDVELNTSTEGDLIRSDAYVEDENKIRYSNDGAIIEPKTLILLPSKVVIKKGDLISVIKLRGVDVIESEQTRRKVLLVFRAGDHSEVLTGGR